VQKTRPPVAPRVASVATALPPHIVTAEQVKQYFPRVFPLDPRRLQVMLSVVDHSAIERRHVIRPVEEIIEPRPLSQLTQEYREHALALGRTAVCQALARAGLAPRDVDLLITVSCTGVLIPSLDAYLINELGFRSDTRRLPITELGCAAGAAALALARNHLMAFPTHCVLILAVELPSLTFQRHDLSQANLISCTLFGDGAAAAVVMPDGAAGPRMLDAWTHLFPASLDAMGFDLRETGFHIVLSREVPGLIRSHIRQLVHDFLSQHGLSLDRIGRWVLHPGGQKLLAFIEEELGLERAQTQPSWDVLRECGNLSSASVLFVLERWLAQPAPEPCYGLLAAFGPGFSAELVLLRWD